MDRRQLLQSLFGQCATGILASSLVHLGMLEQARAATSSPDPGTWKPGLGKTHHVARAQRVLHIFCPGAASHIDLWEHKPELEKYDGKPLPVARIFCRFKERTATL